MTPDPPTLLTAGYRTRSPADLVAMFRQYNIPLGVDIRFAPNATGTRRFRGQHLLDLLTSAGVQRAVHEPALGNRAYHTGGIDVDPAGIAWLAAELEGASPVVLIVCTCAAPWDCHRAYIADQVALRVPGLRVIHLGYEV